jgi:hypothetical protein
LKLQQGFALQVVLQQAELMLAVRVVQVRGFRGEGNMVSLSTTVRRIHLKEAQAATTTPASDSS